MASGSPGERMAVGGIWCPLEESAAVAWLGTNPGLCLPSPGLTAPFVTINHLAQTFQPPGLVFLLLICLA